MHKLFKVTKLNIHLLKNKINGRDFSVWKLFVWACMSVEILLWPFFAYELSEWEYYMEPWCSRDGGDSDDILYGTVM